MKSTRSASLSALIFLSICIAGVFLLPAVSHAGGGGSTVNRNVMPNTLGEPALTNTQCQQDAKICPDGSAVTRTGPNCSFPACSGGDIGVICPQDAQRCPDGSTVTRTGPNCTLEACPSDSDGVGLGVICPQDAQRCPDGSTVTRTGPNCSFPACSGTGNTSDGLIDTGTTPVTAGGSTGGSDTISSNPLANNGAVCRQDAKVCPDGRTVTRTGPNCSFAACPSVTNNGTFGNTPTSDSVQPGLFGIIGNMISGAASAVYNGVTFATQALFGIGGGAASSDGTFANLPNGGSIADAGPGAIGGNFADYVTGDHDGIACTMDAKICPDGSAVGRSGPLCEFADCPSNTIPLGTAPQCPAIGRICADGSVAVSGPNCLLLCSGEQPPIPAPLPSDLSADEITALSIANSLGMNTSNRAVQASIIMAGKKNSSANLRAELKVFIEKYPNIDLSLAAEQAGLGITGTSNVLRAAEALRAMAGYAGNARAYAEEHAKVLRYIGTSSSGTVSNTYTSDGLINTGTTPYTAGGTSGSSGDSNNGFACTEEAKSCPDGSSVWRTGPNCAFAACPTTPLTSDGVMCTMDAKICPDGSAVGRVAPNCEFAACPN